VKKNNIQIILLWSFLVFIGLISRSYFPTDETRYVTVAWNMWLSGDYLVPTLNDVAYSHKPPLLFWLINLGWKLFGVNDWWPRIVPSLFALASVFMTHRIASLLWPNQAQIQKHAIFILLSCGLWVVFSTALMFDMMIAFFTLLGLYGLLMALLHQQFKGWMMFSLAISGGLVAKGPTILVQLLPSALLAFWWSGQKNINLKTWYLPILYSVILGISIALLWAIPAGIRGGETYQHAIFWGQTAHRLVNAFDHSRPFWWYLPLLPLLFFPWFFWGSFWRGIANIGLNELDFGAKFCLAWLVPVFIIFSIISGKQVHYILPLFPGVALLIARSIDNASTNTSLKLNVLPISIAGIVLGSVLLALPFYIKSHPNAAVWIQSIPLWLGGFIIVLSILLYIIPKKDISQATQQISIFSILLITSLMFVIFNSAGAAYDVRPVSNKIKSLENQNIPVAYVGGYAGVYNFLGRLKRSPDIITISQAENWFKTHPNGQVIRYFEALEEVNGQQSEFAQVYKGGAIGILNQAQWANKFKSLTTAPNQPSEQINNQD
jgi:4-amino-4-deoxy-L-arabinose transferase-like glycosyltransferase